MSRSPFKRKIEIDRSKMSEADAIKQFATRGLVKDRDYIKRRKTQKKLRFAFKEGAATMGKLVS